MRVDSSPDNAGTAAAPPDRSGPGKQDGKVYVRNQRLNASQEHSTGSNLADLGQAAARTLAFGREELLRRVYVARSGRPR